MQDWRFDIGIEDGKVVARIFPSSVPDRRFSGLSRGQVEALHGAISSALEEGEPYYDVGVEDGKVVVRAFPSSIPDCRLSGLSYGHMRTLRFSIASALGMYGPPEEDWR
jgi:hypothetical protein